MSTKRELKFRAWRHAIEDVHAFMVYQSENTLGQFFDHNVDEDHDIIMQFTGLRDKNDREIYEGDIVHPIYGNGPHVVTWDQGTCMFDLVREGHSEHLFDTCGIGDLGYSYWEVIGNVHEHPHLLTGEPVRERVSDVKGAEGGPSEGGPSVASPERSGPEALRGETPPNSEEQ